jgi:hypothetical protein
VENRPGHCVRLNKSTTGILDSYPLPVIVVLNERPHGPCINTKVDIEKVKDAIASFCEAKG